MARKLFGKGALLLVNMGMALLIVAPLLYCVSVSFMTEPELFSYPPALLPHQLKLDNYLSALAFAPIFRFILNSLVVASACTAGQLFFGSLAGYGFAMHEFPGKRALFLLMLSTMMIPGQATILANYLTIANLHLTDSYPALILPYLASAFCLFNMRQAFLMLPGELRESAALDGCGSMTFFLRIGLPLVKPQLGSMGVYTFLAVWNQYLWPLLVTNRTEARTVQIGIGMLQNSDGNAYGPIMAGVTMVLIPSVLVFLIGQKSLVSGLTAGAVKG
jgi:sn-glycerol 3-phosphate transport system permease protein